MAYPVIPAGQLASGPISPYATFIDYLNALSADVDGSAKKSANLSDILNAGTARTNLGLGTAAVKDTGTGATNVILGNDARLTDSRTPSSTLTHAASHVAAGSDPLTLSASQITGTAVVTADARLSDTRTPSASSITDGMIATTLSPSKITGTALVATPAAAQTITSAATGHQALILNTLTGQTAAIQEWRVNNAVVSKVSSSGKFQTDIYYALNGAGTHLTLDGTSATFVGNAAGSINTIIKGAASQSGDLTQWQNSSASVLAKIDKDGNLYAPYVLNPTGGSAYSYFRCAVSGVELGNSSGSTLVGLKVWTAAGQSGDLLKLQVNSVDMASVSAAGLGTFAGVTSTALVSTPASATGSAGLRVPPGTTPTSPTSGDVWMTTGSGLLWRNGAATRTAVAIEGSQTISGAKTFSALLTTLASAAGGAGLNLPAGAAPTAPVDGDIWTTTAGLFVRINGVTKTVTLT